MRAAAARAKYRVQNIALLLERNGFIRLAAQNDGSNEAMDRTAPWIWGSGFVAGTSVPICGLAHCPVKKFT
jgi:hypothetical protein